MRAVVQRVTKALVKVDQDIVGEIDKGFLIYLGIHHQDTEETVIKMADKIHLLRVFEDEQGKMNLNLSQVNGSVLVISQFTLYGNTKGNNRPSFTEAASPDHASKLYQLFCQRLRMHHTTQEGVFGAHMQIESVNDGPVTILIEY